MAGRDRDLESCPRRGTGVSFHFPFLFFVLESCRRRGTDVFLKGTFRFALSQISVCLDTCWCPQCVPLCVLCVRGPSSLCACELSLLVYRVQGNDSSSITTTPSTPPPPSPPPFSSSSSSRLLLPPHPPPPHPLLLLLSCWCYTECVATARNDSRWSTRCASLTNSLTLPPLITPLPYLPY